MIETVLWAAKITSPMTVPAALAAVKVVFMGNHPDDPDGDLPGGGSAGGLTIIDGGKSFDASRFVSEHPLEVFLFLGLSYYFWVKPVREAFRAQEA